MIQKHGKPPATQRTFANAWAELDYLCTKTRYWLYARRERAAAMRCCDRLAGVLRKLPSNEVAILREEGLALLGELKRDLADAIFHRGREIKLMERFHREASSSKYSVSTRDYMLQDRDADALQQRKRILGALEEASNHRGR
jgi:hypothetical protein